MYKKIKFFNVLLIIFLSANLIADENYFYDNIIINSDVVEASKTRILFKGNVRITSNEMNIEGSQATFLTEESALIILGTPTNTSLPSLSMRTLSLEELPSEFAMKVNPLD